MVAPSAACACTVQREAGGVVIGGVQREAGELSRASGVTLPPTIAGTSCAVLSSVAVPRPLMVMVLVASASSSKCGVMVSATEPSSLTLAEAATASVAVEHRRLGDRVDGERDGLAGGVGGGCALGGVRLHRAA